MTTTNQEARTWRRFVRDTHGTEIAEMAVILPLLFMLLMGIFWFGQAFRIYGTLTQAARAGARAAVAPVCATCSPPTGVGPGQYAQTAVQSAMAAANLNANQLVQISQWTTPAPPQCLCRTPGAAPSCTPVTCDGTVAINMCVQENVQLSYPTPATGPVGMGTCGTAVSMRYKYPFSFKLPLTNLDLGNIQLPGQAQMRAEAQ
jgi:hypothetical protein